MFNNKRGFVTLIGLLFVIVIIGVLYLTYFRNLRIKPTVDTELKSLAEQHNVDTSSYKGVLKSTRQEIKALEDQMLKTEENLYKQYYGD